MRKPVRTKCLSCQMHYGKGVRRIGEICHNAAEFADIYTMPYERWLEVNRVRLRNLYYEECANFCRRPVVKA